MRSLALIVVAGAATAATGQTLESSSLWTTGSGANGHEYRLYSIAGGINWDDAQTYATSIGGYLATITSAEENAFVFSSLAIGTNNNVWHVDSFNSQIGPWLGGRQLPGDPEPAGYQWVTGETFSFTSWAPGEPNNSGGTENRLHYFGNPSRSQNWNDITDSVLIEGFVVEVVPAPGSMGVVGAGMLLMARRRRR